jgi:hypothetical protein
MRIERYKNFFSLEECDALNAWVDEGVQNKWLDVGVDNNPEYPKRFTSRLYADRFKYPQLVRDIADRVRSFCGVNNYNIIEDYGQDGVVVSCIFEGGDVYPHKDPRQGYLSALRCNVMTRAADAGAELYVGGQLVDIEVGELHCYLASDFEHKVTEVRGDIPRVLWMFGAAVPAEDWESGKIKVGESNG